MNVSVKWKWRGLPQQLRNRERRCVPMTRGRSVGRDRKVAVADTWRAHSNREDKWTRKLFLMKILGERYRLVAHKWGLLGPFCYPVALWGLAYPPVDLGGGEVTSFSRAPYDWSEDLEAGLSSCSSLGLCCCQTHKMYLPQFSHSDVIYFQETVCQLRSRVGSLMDASSLMVGQYLFWSMRSWRKRPWESAACPRRLAAAGHVANHILYVWVEIRRVKLF